MYIPKPFIIDDQETLHTIIEENSFATLFTQHNGKPHATHLPLYLDREANILYGHFARANPQWKDCTEGEALAVFHGPHAYISPSWYETDQTVPTWNYVAVHVYGKIELIRDDSENIEALSALVGKYEGPDSPYSFGEVDPKVSSGLRKGIVGFKMPISSMEGKAKLSQNHSPERQKRVIEQLEKRTDENSLAIAALMRENLHLK
ncbi:FMN-binding negative transcriptional regulator [Bacillus sp. KH172YL63]|uniref:FMN-binding negative transcriptional regulator n=1 Tax=Bacillus sp. KH172YL63 TaxID=2709784 RepID=UPI0013E4E740|nr:FMN-binding negative transcriptional regulator [Bacillus sp. KH172YL63]BCB05464.1 protease synthase and sporulation protein PAI 2 [Bacillus sp. KH172YL63]